MKNFFITSIITSISSLSLFAGSTSVPAELETQLFADAKMAPCPAVIATSPYGDVFVGVDMQGSLGKKPNLGYITKLTDTDQDGKADKRTIFAEVDNPRGIISIDNRLIVLHCTQQDGKIHTQQLSLYTDADNDGIADGPPKPLITNIGNPKFLKSRGTDHSTNNIRLGIDGWIYISIGDFGFVNAQGTDGKKLTMHGGGVVRVRPDGSEMETFIHGTRNVYDVSIDPFMNVFTRENTNDGVGWWIRFSHYVQSGQYGYPSLYTNFPEDMIPAIGEYGGGSGTGNLYFEEPGWPDKYNKTFMMADWGRSHIYIHRLTEDGASFTDKPEEFISTTQVSDLDVDASGRMYIASWDGAGYAGNPNKGFVSIVTPKDWQYKKFPNLKTLKDNDLVNLINTPSSTIRVYTQQEILRRNEPTFIPLLTKIVANKSTAIESRVAAIFTIAQLAGPDAHSLLNNLAQDKSLKEHCIRAMADRLEFAKTANKNTIIAALNDSNPRVKVAAAIAIGRMNDLSLADHLLKNAAPPKDKIKLDAKFKKVISSKIKGKQTININADISTFKELYLIVEGDSKNIEVAWMNPTVHQKFGKSTDMTKYKWKSAKQGKRKTRVNRTCRGMYLPKKGKGIGTSTNSVIAFKMPPKSVTFTATGIITNTKSKGSVRFIVSRSPDPDMAGLFANTHSTPNQAIILPHVAMQSLLKLDAQDACISALKSSDSLKQRAALATMKFMHSEKIVDALIKESSKHYTPEIKALITDTLIRIHQKEDDYDGSTWWQTRPNPDGPYYHPVDWQGTEKISAFLKNLHDKSDEKTKAALIAKLKKNKAHVPELNQRPKPKVKIAKKIKKTSIEDIILYVNKHNGNAKKGAKIINKVGCAACHNIKAGDLIKGPDLSKLGHLKNADIAESIIKPAAVIAKSWVTITMKNGTTSHTGTIVKKDSKQIILHDIAGKPTKIDPSKVAKIGPGLNMMSMHLCDDLTLKEFADLIGYIKSMDKAAKK